jgi:hypothetical protein
MLGKTSGRSNTLILDFNELHERIKLMEKRLAEIEKQR